MPVLEVDPGTSPESPGLLSFYEQGKDPATGFQVTSSGVITAAGGQSVAGDLEVTGGLTVEGFTALAAAQTSGDLTVYGGALALGSAGGGLRVKEGTNATMGAVALTAGAATVTTTKVTANSRIFLTPQVPGGTPGWVRISARTPGTSFTITSSSGTDTSTVAWLILEPA